MSKGTFGLIDAMLDIYYGINSKSDASFLLLPKLAMSVDCLPHVNYCELTVVPVCGSVGGCSRTQLIRGCSACLTDVSFPSDAVELAARISTGLGYGRNILLVPGGEECCDRSVSGQAVTGRRTDPVPCRPTWPVPCRWPADPGYQRCRVRSAPLSMRAPPTAALPPPPPSIRARSIRLPADL